MTSHNETDPVRRQIRDAMNRIYAGQTKHADAGGATVMDLVRESGVKRHYLTHRHVDLANEFVATIAAKRNAGIPEAEAALIREVESLKEQLTTSEHERIRWFNQSRDYKRIIQVLVKEREALTEERDSLRKSLAARPRRADSTLLTVVPDPDEPA